jgi:hypothetical protein
VSLLEFHARPLVAFDPSKKEHRRIYHEFVTNRSWGKSPYRFICPEDHGFDLVTMMQRKLIEYYVDKEFGKPVPVETARKDVQKVRRLVDKKSK